MHQKFEGGVLVIFWAVNGNAAHRTCLNYEINIVHDIAKVLQWIDAVVGHYRRERWSHQQSTIKLGIDVIFKCSIVFVILERWKIFHVPFASVDIELNRPKIWKAFLQDDMKNLVILAPDNNRRLDVALISQEGPRKLQSQWLGFLQWKRDFMGRNRRGLAVGDDSNFCKRKKNQRLQIKIKCLVNGGKSDLLTSCCVDLNAANRNFNFVAIG